MLGKILTVTTGTPQGMHTVTACTYVCTYVCMCLSTLSGKYQEN